MNSNEIIEHIQSIIKCPLKPIDDLLLMMQWDYSNHYLLDPRGKLIGLNLRGNGMREDQITWLPHARYLQGLNLSENEFSELQIPDLPDLIYLNLSANKSLQKLSWQSPLPRLSRLECHRCRLQEFELLDGFTELQWLDVSRNGELHRFTLPADCDQLTYLDLSGNQLSRFELVANGAQSLEYLYLPDNKLSAERIRLPSVLPNLSTLHLRGNQLKEFHFPWLDQMPKLQSLYLYDNPLPVTYYATIRERDNQKRSCLDFMRRYYHQLERGANQDREYKVLLIGNGRSGKTSFVRRLVYNKFIDEYDATQGIQIERYPRQYKIKKHEETDPILNIWDFAGQEIYHATHRLFMQRDALYLLMWSKDTLDTFKEEQILLDPQGIPHVYENMPLEYWLDYASVLGDRPPIILVQTKSGPDGKFKDGALPENYKKDYKDKFTAFRDVWIESMPVGEYEEDNYAYLLRTIELMILKQKKNQGQTKIPSSWLQFRRRIRDCQLSGEKTLNLESFFSMAKPFGLKVTDALDVLTWFKSTGVVFHQSGYFRDKIVLDQAWAIDAIYTLLNQKHEFYFDTFRNAGLFTGKQLIHAFEELGYSERGEYELFLDYMLSCKMCFELNAKKKDQYKGPLEDRQFVLIQNLDKNKSELVESFWENQEAYHIRYDYNFLHQGLIQSFIAYTHEFAHTEFEAAYPKITSIWKSGIHLTGQENQSATVEVVSQSEPHLGVDSVRTFKKRILVRITKNAKPLLDKIRNLIEELQDETATESVSLDGRQFVDWNKLKLYEENSTEEFIKDVGGNWAPLQPLRKAFLGRKDSRFESSNSEDDNSKMKTIARIYQLIESDQLKEALKLMKRPCPEQRDEVYKLSIDYNQMNSNKLQGLLDPEILIREERRITHYMLDLINKCAEREDN